MPSSPKTALGELPAQIGRYQILNVIGEGGMGVVVEALHIPMQRKVALKMLRPAIAKDKQFLDRFYREIRALGKVLDSQHVILATDGGEEGGIPFLTTEYIEGMDLDRLLHACGGTLPVGQACEMICQAAMGLECIHQHGLVHRDLKPTNLMRTNLGVVKILDLGLARLIESEDEQSELTPTLGILGTLDYQAPEQAQDPHGVDIRADIYSLGCTLFKLLSGDAPYKGFERFDKIRAHAREPIPEMPTNIPDGVRVVIRKMLAKDRAERYQTPMEVAIALAPFAERDAGLTIAFQNRDVGAAPTPIAGTTPVNSALETLSALHDVTPTTHLLRETRKRPAIRTVSWMLGVSLGLMCLAGTLVTLFPSLIVPQIPISLNEPKVRDPDPPDLLLLDDLKPLETRFLLEQKPQPILWTPINPISNFRPESRRLSVLCAANEDSLFLLGKVTASNYELQMRIFQPESTYGVGVVLGYRSVPQPYPLFPGRNVLAQDMVVGEFQMLSFQPSKRKDKSPDLLIVRSLGKHYRRPNNQEAVYYESHFSERVPMLFNERTLTLVVQNHRLSRVFLEGHPELGKLVTPECNKIFGPDWQQGQIGVWVNGTNVVFSDAGFRLLTK